MRRGGDREGLVEVVNARGPAAAQRLLREPPRLLELEPFLASRETGCKPRVASRSRCLNEIPGVGFQEWVR